MISKIDPFRNSLWYCVTNRVSPSTIIENLYNFYVCTTFLEHRYEQIRKLVKSSGRGIIQFRYGIVSKSMVHLHRSSLNGDRVVPGIYPGSSSIMFRKYPLRYDESPEMLGISATNPNVMFPRWILAKQPIVRPRRRAKNASHQRINRSARTERSRSLHAFLVMPGGCRVEKSLSQNIVISLLDNN